MTTYTKQLLKAFLKNPLGFVSAHIDNTVYQIKCYFFPYNVVKMQQLPSTWIDRDTLMLHAMFQILVDFIELEQPFTSWTNKKPKRDLDRKEMHNYIEMHFNTQKAREENYYDGCNDTHKKVMDRQLVHLYNINKEIMYLYEWYKDEKYELDFQYYYNATGVKLKLGNGRMQRIPTGSPILITSQELLEIEDEHKLICSIMLQRILEVREYLWT